MFPYGFFKCPSLLVIPLFYSILSPALSAPTPLKTSCYVIPHYSFIVLHPISPSLKDPSFSMAPTNLQVFKMIHIYEKLKS